MMIACVLGSKRLKPYTQGDNGELVAEIYAENCNNINIIM